MSDWDFDGDEDYTDGVIDGLIWGLNGWELLLLLVAIGIYLAGHFWLGLW